MNSNFCLIIPAYNEEKRLNIDQFLSFLTQNKHAALLFVNDGSIDNTALVLNKIKALNPDQVAILSLKNNVGKAESVRQGYLFALKKNFSFIGFFDADLSTPLNESLRMLESFNQNSQIEYVFGSRIARMGSNINRKGYRHYLGRIIATFIDTYLRLSVYDTQCGAKLMRKELATVIFEQPFVSKWLFDVCAVYGNRLGGESPLWGFVIANH